MTSIATRQSFALLRRRRFGAEGGFASLGMIRDWNPALAQGGQTLIEEVESVNGELGSTDAADTNDPAWQGSPAALVYDGDDYVRIADPATDEGSGGIVVGGLRNDWDPYYGQGGQNFDDREGTLDGQLGSTSGSDTNDPTWQSSPPALDHDGDDYVTIAGVPS